ncbi:MAG: hypothetical protein OEW15_15070 [Nitrospirota bacterium]|nr:hypothetical protein [Nitrospirota bacterium]
MEPCRRKQTGRTAGANWDILLIDETARLAADKLVHVEECDGMTIITACSEEAAIDVLQVASVDVIYNFPASGKRVQAEKFRAHISERYPHIRIQDLWTPPSQQDGGGIHHVPPLFLREVFDCDARRQMSRSGVHADSVRR